MIEYIEYIVKFLAGLRHKKDPTRNAPGRVLEFI
jgi:hypothetical protein